jgi:adenylate cyclase
MKSKIIIREIKTSLVTGVKIGILGALIGLVSHSLWGNFDEIKYTVINGFIIGFLIGFIEQIFSSSRIGRWPYSVLLLLRIISYFIITLTTIYTLLIVYLKNNGLSSSSLSDPQIFEEVKKVYFLANINTLYVLLIILVVSFLWQLKPFFGQGVIFNYLIGKYHKPTSEERIFMFLDLNSATTLGEKLGSKKYSSLLHNFFNDLDFAFEKTKGYVHQYVGDEVVVIWKLKSGLKNNNCIRSYFMAVDRLENRKEYYLKKYNVFPTFKASIHLGPITITEIGASKKEIAYHGDTINTASRICSFAHTLGNDLLISNEVYNRLNKNDNIIFEDLGEHQLKGKIEKIQLYGVRI